MSTLPPTSAPLPYNFNAPQQRVVVTDVDMSIGKMCMFMVKWVIASIPAIIILWLIGLVVAVILAALFGGAIATLTGLGHTPSGLH